MNSAGPFTCYFNLNKLNAPPINFEAQSIQFTLVYLPTAYGTVVPSLLGSADAPRPVPMTVADMAAERERSILADLARRDAELAETTALMNELRDRVAQLERRLDEPRRAPRPVIDDQTANRRPVVPPE